MTTESLANILYDKYCEAVGGKAFNGDPLPPWTAFSTDPAKAKQSNGWRVVAATAYNAIISEFADECKRKLIKT